MRITILGTGYVGLVTGACLADLGHDVWCVDVDQEKIDLLREGCIPMYEPGLPALVSRNRSAQRLHFSTDLASAMRAAQLVFLAVGTPSDAAGAADLRHVLDAARALARHLGGFQVIVVKSTVPVGTCASVRQLIHSELRACESDARIAVVSNPEFLKEGAAIADFMRPDRIVIGFDPDEEGRRAAALLGELYAPLIARGQRILWMDPRSAELAKYAANAMLAARISFMNEMANLAEALGADIEAVREAIGADPRIGPDFLRAGCGYGGSCFPKDVQALRQIGREHGREMLILDAVHEVNRRQKTVLVTKVAGRFGRRLYGRRFAIWGLAFKPETDDMREAPARVLVRELAARGAALAVYDPVAMNEARRAITEDLAQVQSSAARIHYADDAYEALREADALLVVTEWSAFRHADLVRIKALMKAPIVFDGRNIFAPDAMQRAGFEYYPIGRPSHTGR